MGRLFRQQLAEKQAENERLRNSWQLNESASLRDEREETDSMNDPVAACSIRDDSWDPGNRSVALESIMEMPDEDGATASDCGGRDCESPDIEHFLQMSVAEQESTANSPVH